MAKKTLILIIAGSFIGITTFFLWTAQLAKKASNDILTEFKKVDNSLTKSNDSLKNKEEGVGAFKLDSFYMPQVDLSFKVNKICVRIDSIRNDLRPLIRRKDKNPLSYKNTNRIKALKTDLLSYNAFIEKYFSNKSKIKASDLVNVTDIKKEGILIPWEVYYFENTNVNSMSTILTFIYRQVLKIQQKAIQVD